MLGPGLIFTRVAGAWAMNVLASATPSSNTSIHPASRTGPEQAAATDQT